MIHKPENHEKINRQAGEAPGGAREATVLWELQQGMACAAVATTFVNFYECIN